MKIRIKIEIRCETCEGEGQILSLEDNVAPILNCSDCDGTGYQEEYVSLADFKDLVKEEK